MMNGHVNKRADKATIGACLAAGLRLTSGPGRASGPAGNVPTP